MKYPVPTLIAAVFVLLPSFTIAKDFSWAEVVKKVYPSVVAVQRKMVDVPIEGHEVSSAPMSLEEAISATPKTVCTGFVINAHQDYVMTAHHCLNDGTDTNVFVDGEPTRLLWSSAALDAAVLSVKTRKPAIKRSLLPLEWGTPVATLGYGYVLDGALFRAGYVANPSLKFPASGYPDAVWFMFDSQFISGMSGGAVFDSNGQVVSMVQMGDNWSGIGRPIAHIYAASTAYWQ